MERSEYLKLFEDETDWYNDIVLTALLPDSAWKPLPRFARAWLRNYIGGTILYFASAFLWCFYIYYLKSNVYLPKDAIPSNHAMLLQIKVAMKAMPWYCALPTLSEFMAENGWTRCFSSIGEVGWPMYFVYLTIYLALCEFGIYWMHRELHDIKPLYKHLHATHHIYNKQNTLSPFAAGSMLKKQILDDRRFPKMHLNLQRLLQVVTHGEQVFPRVKEKCVSKGWFASEDIVSFEELIGRLRRLKENLGFIVNRVTAVQAGLDSWQSEQINKKLYYLSFLSMIFLPLSIVTGIFGMNVGGLPWTGKNDPSLKDGFLNVMLICAAMLFLFLLGFSFPSIYSRVSAWKRRQALNKSCSFSRKSFKRLQRNGGYHRI